MSERPMPHSIEAEKATLGSIIIDPSAIKHIPWLRPSDFYRDTHRAIFEAILALHQANIPPNEIMVTDYLQQHGQLEEIGGQGALLAFVSYVPNSTAIEHYALTVLNRAIARKIVEIVEIAAARAYEDHSPDEALDEAMQALANLKRRKESITEEEDLFTPSEALTCPQPPAIWSGILHKGERMEIFGESGAWKTWFGIYLACCFANGQNWFRRKTYMSGRVLYIAAEDFMGVAIRTHAWLRAHHLPYSHLDSQMMIYRKPVSLRNHASIQHLISCVQRRDFHPDMIIIDNYLLCYEGSDIDGNQNREAFRGIDALQEAFKDKEGIWASAIILNHTNKANNAYYGSSTHRNFVTSMLGMARDREHGTSKVTFMKTRNMAEPEDLILKLEAVKVNTGGLSEVSSCVVTEADMQDYVEAMDTRKLLSLQILADLGGAEQEVQLKDWKAAALSRDIALNNFKRDKDALEHAGDVTKREVNARVIFYHLTTQGKTKVRPTGPSLDGLNLEQKPNFPEGGEGELHAYGSDGQPYCKAHVPK